jgi:hypothetical protein
MVATASSTERAALAVLRKRDRPNQRRRKAGQRERSIRGGHEVWAGPVKTFRSVGDAKNGTAGLRAKGNLRGKRSDPWLWANALPGAVADPERGAKRRRASCRRVLAWSAVRWRNHQTKRAERPHSKSSGREPLDGPAMRPETPLAVENGVGKRAALCGAPNVRVGKRAWRTPIPQFVPDGLNPPAGTF